MALTAKEVTQIAMNLPSEDRARLAQELLASLQDPAEVDVQAAWDAEIRRRLSEIESGTAELAPAEEVFAEIRRLLA
ncbi:MAG: addiction module protein [Chloroflexota bacterium]